MQEVREDGREGTRMEACATRYVGCALKGNTTQMELRLSSLGGCRPRRRIQILFGFHLSENQNTY